MGQSLWNTRISISSSVPPLLSPSPSSSVSPLLSPSPMTSMLVPKNPSWRNCKRETCSISGACEQPFQNRSKELFCCADTLFVMLNDVVSILQSQGIDLFIIYGTLIGSLRDQDIISFTPDVDIGIESHNYISWKKWQSILNKEGYLIFNSGILRICSLDVKRLITTNHRGKNGFLMWMFTILRNTMEKSIQAIARRKMA